MLYPNKAGGGGELGLLQSYIDRHGFLLLFLTRIVLSENWWTKLKLPSVTTI